MTKKTLFLWSWYVLAGSMAMACTQNKSERAKDLFEKTVELDVKTNNINIKAPFYEIEIKTNDCPIEVLVNDMPCFANYRKGGMAVDWPINENILSSGRQHFEVRSFPYEGETEIREAAFIAIKIFVRDAFAENTYRTLVEEFPTIYFKEKARQQYSYQDIFPAKIPYKVEGWENSVNLMEENKEELLAELAAWYDKLFNVFIRKDQTEYNKINTERIKELAIANYWDDVTVKKEQDASFFSLPTDIKKVPLEAYRLAFFGKGKVVGLRLPYDSPGFMFKLRNDDNQDFLEFALFHRKEENSDLALIR